MHGLLDGFLPEGRHHVGLVSLTGPRRRDLRWHEAKVQELARRSAALDEPEVAALASRLIEEMPGVVEEIGRLDSSLADARLLRLVIHGDYGVHNLLFRSGDRAVPVDFELSRLDLRLNDIVSALVKYRYTGGVYDLISMETFLTAYAEVFPFTDAELDLLEPVWRSYKLQAAVQYWNSYFETAGPTRKLRSALDSIDQARWVAARPDVVDRLRRVAAAAGAHATAGSTSLPTLARRSTT
jgi:Ser/Thr protein kinase RdoA (MazF antagonist)